MNIFINQLQHKIFYHNWFIGKPFWYAIRSHCFAINWTERQPRKLLISLNARVFLSVTALFQTSNHILHLYLTLHLTDKNYEYSQSNGSVRSTCSRSFCTNHLSIGFKGTIDLFHVAGLFSSYNIHYTYI